MKPSPLFAQLSHWIARASGNPLAFLLALSVIVLWAVTGPVFNYSDTWQLIINTGTTIVTFLMVFLIQNTQNRDSQAVQLKLDELIRATLGAKNAMIDLEEQTEEDLDQIRDQYQQLAEEAREGRLSGPADSGRSDS